MNLRAALKAGLGALGADPRALYQTLSAASIDAAIAEQGLGGLAARLRGIVPDLSDQYTDGFDRIEYQRYWERKMRGLHAFQVRCIEEALAGLGRDGLVLADIGDSSGNHSLYLKAMLPPGRLARVISVNLDPVAVDKVRAKGGDAILCRAEEMDLEGIRPDLFLSFEMVEHLTDPVRFLHGLAARGSAEHLLFTVPWRRVSRFGGAEFDLADDRLPARMTPESLHVFEFSPADWVRLARLGGYRVEWTRIYRQYPRRSPLRLTAPLWRAFDFEGFVAVFGRRDLSFARRYSGW